MPPYLIDSHCHLHDQEFFTSAQQTDFLAEASDNNVRQIVCIGTSEEDSALARAFAVKHENVFWTFGIHPEDAPKASCSGFCPSPQTPAKSSESLQVSASSRRSVSSLDDRATNLPKLEDDLPARRGQGPKTELEADTTKLVAIGEIGLDYHYDNYDKHAQWSLLEQMLSLATDLNLPCSFHVRDALPDFFSILTNFPNLKPSVLHSFTDSPENLNKALDLGLYIGLNGIATFANLPCYRSLSPSLLPRLVLETDAPFLTPVPKRGIINRPGNIKYIAEWLANQTGVSVDKIAEITTKNVKQLFNLPDPGRGYR